MKIITVRAPWPWWIMYGGKDIENRSRRWSYQGPLLISQSAAWKEFEVTRDHVAAMSIWGRSGNRPTLPKDHASMMREWCGHIVGLVDMMGCTEDSPSPWFVGRFGYGLTRPRPLTTPIPWKGAQSVQDAPDHIRAEVARQLGDRT